MSNTLLTFQDRYFSYHRGEQWGAPGLVIEGFESSFLADLAMSYILEHTHHLFDDDKVYKGVYRDDDIYVTNSL